MKKTKPVERKVKIALTKTDCLDILNAIDMAEHYHNMLFLSDFDHSTMDMRDFKKLRKQQYGYRRVYATFKKAIE